MITTYRLIFVVFVSLILLAGCSSGGSGSDDKDQGKINPVVAKPTQAVSPGDQVTLDASGSSHTTTGISITGFSWTQISGPTVTLQDSDTDKATFIAPTISVTAELEFELTITASNNQNAKVTVKVTVMVNPANQPPDANAGLDQTVTSGDEVTLDGTGSSDPDVGDSIATYLWTQSSGPTVSISDSDKEKANFTAPVVMSNTDLVFKLTVTDMNGDSAEDEVTVTVEPTAAVSLSGTVASGTPVKGSVTVKGSNNQTVSTTIADNGSFSISLDGLTPPFILLAEGAVNNRAVKYYSMAVDSGVVNITQITSYILANAAGSLSDPVYTNWDTAGITIDQFNMSKSQVSTQLSLVLAGFAIDNSFDLVNSPFSANYTGFDLVLDAIDIGYSGNIATVSNVLSGTSITNDLTDPLDNTTVLAAPNISEAIAEQDAINLLFDKIEVLFATSAPNQAAVDTFSPFVAAEYLENGGNENQVFDRWVNSEPSPLSHGFPIGLLLYATIDGVIDVSATNYDKGYLVTVNLTSSLVSYAWQTTVVYDGANWLWMGNQQWLETNLNFSAFKWISGVSPVETYTGFDLGGLQDKFNYAADAGVLSGIITGPGLPAEGKAMRYFATATENGFDFVDNSEFYYYLDDNTIATIPDNAEYTIALYAEAPDQVNLSNTPLVSYTVIVPKPPYLNSELNDNLFPDFVLPTGHNVTDANIPGMLDVEWGNSIAGDVIMAGLGWDDASLLWNFIAVFIPPGETSVTFDTSSASLPTDFAMISLLTRDIYGRNINTYWLFDVF